MIQECSHHMVQYSFARHAKNLEKQEQMRLYSFEKQVLDKFTEMAHFQKQTVKEYAQMINEEMNPQGEERSFTLSCNVNGTEKISQEFYLNVYFLSWLASYRMSLLTDSYIIRTEVSVLPQNVGKIDIVCFLPKGVWEKQQKDRVEHAISEMTVDIMEEYAQQCATVADAYEVIYHLQLPVGE